MSSPYLIGIGLGIIIAAGLYDLMECHQMCFPPERPRRKQRFYLVVPNTYKAPGVMQTGESAAVEQPTKVDPEYRTEVDSST
jgi:hypothetical protein